MTSAVGSRASGLSRESLRDVVAYNTERTPVPIDLSHNTNLFGAPPRAVEALRQVDGRMIAEYPGLDSADVRRALAKYAGVDEDAILTGCGSDQIIESAFHALTEAGDTVAYPDPTFSMVPVFARMTELVPLGVPLTDGFQVDIDGLLATNARIIYVAAPNNPTGVPVPAASIERLLAEAPGLIFVDEAYAEFCGSEWMRRAPSHRRLVVARTMSKAFAMAGLRIGYGSAAPELLSAMEKARGPYTVNALAERAVVAALAHDVEWMRGTVRDAIECRERFAAQLREIGLAPLPSATNFLLIPMADAVGVARRMEALGVRVRAHPNMRRIGNALRITVAPWPLMERAWSALCESLSGHA